MIPGTDVPYEMVPIPPGEFLMGSPDAEPGRQKDESPQHRVKISPFWMGRFEVTWDQYLLFMYPDDEKKLRESHPMDAAINEISDAVTRPSKPYVDMSFGMGKSSRTGGKGFPAIAMTQHAANKFCHWLSAKTGHFYRLPTEAEWEYACRAGTTTAYFFGDNPAKVGDYAWFEKNSGGHPRPVGQKQPNPWGLYDMAGNVWEWCNDFYKVDYYQESPRENPRGPTEGQNKVLRGGAWRFSADNCRSGYRYNESPGYSDVCFGYDIYGFRCVRRDAAAGP
jgi:formylglycine-generating enzyme required for sulfatase activity